MEPRLSYGLQDRLQLSQQQPISASPRSEDWNYNGRLSRPLSVFTSV